MLPKPPSIEQLGDALRRAYSGAGGTRRSPGSDEPA
jgi:hypothetical protein